MEKERGRGGEREGGERERGREGEKRGRKKVGMEKVARVHAIHVHVVSVQCIHSQSWHYEYQRTWCHPYRPTSLPGLVVLLQVGQVWVNVGGINWGGHGVEHSTVKRVPGREKDTLSLSESAWWLTGPDTLPCSQLTF